MPTEITRPPAPISRRVGTQVLDSRDVASLSLTALAIIAILALILHVASVDLLDRSPAPSLIAAPDEEAKCPADAKPSVLSLPYD